MATVKVEMDVYPIAFFLPTTAAHVQAAVRCGVAAKIRLIPNSGGHAYDSISTGNNSTLIVDFHEMQKVEVIGTGKYAIAQLQPGALLGPATAQLWKLAKVGIPVGNCLTVGLGGHAIGGGIGLFSFVYGLLIDNVLEYEMVDAKGNIVYTSETENPDLFWALRGVGGGYIGIITRFRIRTFQADMIRLSLVRMVYPVKDFVKVVSATQDWMAWTRDNEPLVGTMALAFNDNWNVSDSVTPGGSEPGIIVASFHIYDPDRNPTSNATFLRKISEMFPPGGKKIVMFPPYLAMHYATGYAPVVLPPSMPAPDAPGSLQQAGEGGFVFPPDDYIVNLFMKFTKQMAIVRYFKARSQFVKRKLTMEELERLGEIMLRIPNNRAGLLINTEHGAIQKVAADKTAYVHRKVGANFRIHVTGTTRDGNIPEAVEWMEEFWAAMKSFDGGETYQNFPDLDVKDYLKRYYGSNLDKLVSTKKRWDPTNYFVNQQSLPLKIIKK
ncbi:Reticuline oxidase [Folsomia candida]|uniref:Reticuline oxidase n=1 Tax=Folsomia candida TaxID=158441 RepID=A0A226DMK7_FOLCA|nr:Reticuline oxidase [Folsomia candida]